MLTFLSMQVAELEAQAATEPTPVSEKEGPSPALEQLESLVQTKDQVSTEHVSMCVPKPHLPWPLMGEPGPPKHPGNSSPLGDSDTQEPGWWSPRGP